jgi:hypothetical protein
MEVVGEKRRERCAKGMKVTLSEKKGKWWCCRAVGAFLRDSGERYFQNGKQ